jgi:hypothetical protein
MSGKKDEEIQRKLAELESAVLKETPLHPSVIEIRSDLTTTGHQTGSKVASETTTSVGNDLCYFGGIGLILTGLFMFFNTVRVGTGFLNLFGMGGSGFGLLMIPLMFGIGWLIYNPKSKIPWLLVAATCAVICFSVLSSLIMSFPQTSLLGLMMILLPFAAGGALLLKGVGGPKAIEDKLKNSK